MWAATLFFCHSQKKRKRKKKKKMEEEASERVLVCVLKKHRSIEPKVPIITATPAQVLSMRQNWTEREWNWFIDSSVSEWNVPRLFCFVFFARLFVQREGKKYEIYGIFYSTFTLNYVHVNCSSNVIQFPWCEGSLVVKLFQWMWLLLRNLFSSRIFENKLIGTLAK